MSELVSPVPRRTKVDVARHSDYEDWEIGLGLGLSPGSILIANLMWGCK
jgi:hypothetical protein